MSSTDHTTTACPYAATGQETQQGLDDHGFDHLDPQLSEPTLWATYQTLLERPSAHRSHRHGGFWVLSHYQDVKGALRGWETFSSADGHRIPHVEGMGTIPIDFDPPLHGPYRDLVVHALRPDRVRQLQPFVNSTIEDLVDRLVSAGGGDVVTELALPLPLTVLQELVGFSADAVAQFRELTAKVWAEGSPEAQLRGRAALATLIEDEIISHKRDRPDDYLTWLIDAEVEGRPVRHDEVVSACLSLAVAGHETTMNSVGSLVYLLASVPDVQDRLRQDPGQAPAFVEEMLRLLTPSQCSARRVTRDVEVDGEVLEAGDWVLLLNGAANRDERQFDHPDEFDLERSARGHLAFGWGIHQCVGSALARMELRILLETLARHPRLSLAGEPTFSALEAGNHYGPTFLPIRFEDA